MAPAVDVFLGNALAGKLTQRRGRLYFQYTRAWLASRRFIPLSVTLPGRKTEFGDAHTRAYFDNLLPEADLRAAIARALGASSDDSFGLLAHLGGDCNGAVSLWPIGQRNLTRSAYTKLSLRRLKESIAAGKRQPLMLIHEGLRMSCAGSQDKLPVALSNGRVLLPLGTAASTHVVKPPSKEHPHVCLNEYFCMQFARFLGVPVGDCSLPRKLDGAYVMRRFDRRIRTRGSPVRLHQIDFCQATNTPPTEKYETDGGPTLKACARVLDRHSTRPARDKLRLAQWAICNFIIGNCDAHGKNLSFMLGGNSARLAPIYDLVCTAIYPDYPKKLALSVAGEADPGRLTARHWRRLSAEIGVPPRATMDMIARFLRRSEAASRRALAATSPGTPGQRKTLEKIRGIIEERTAKLGACMEGRRSRKR